MLVYSNEDFKHLCNRITDLNKRLAKEDGKVVSLERRKGHEKTIERIEDDLKTTAQRVDAQKFKTNLLSAVLFFFLYRLVAAYWTGTVIAYLPFIPVKMVEGLSTRGLTSPQPYDCAFGLIYTLCTIGVKANIPKLLGFVTPKSAFDHKRMAARQQRKDNKEQY